MDRKPEAKSFKQLTISVEKLPALMARQETISSYAVERARLLLGCYRTGDANDPETYVAAISAVLARYPEDVITVVTHPVTGLPSRSNWLPTVKEMTDACEAEIRGAHERAAREARIRKQLAEREEFERPRDDRPSLDELKAKYGDNWGIDPPAAPRPAQRAPDADELRRHYVRHDLAGRPKQQPEEPAQ